MPLNPARVARCGRFLLLAILLPSCSETRLPPQTTTMSGKELIQQPLFPTERTSSAGTPAPSVVQGVQQIGTGQFRSQPGSSIASRAPLIPPGEPVTLDFVNVDVRDVVRSVLGGILRVPYAIDPAVQGAVTLQTPQPVARETVPVLLERTLLLSGLALVARDGTYQIVLLANAARDASVGGAGAGFASRIVPLRFVSAADIQRALEPLTPVGTTVRADPSRNQLIVTGPAQSVADLLQNVQVFDADYLRGMSFALLPLQVAQARDVAREVNELLGSSASPLNGVVRIVPLERLNALLVTTAQPIYIGRVRGWVARFDRTSTLDRRLFVYRVQNGRAADLASVIRRAFGIETTTTAASTVGRARTRDGLTGFTRGASLGGSGSGMSSSGSLGSGSAAASVQNPLLGDLPAAPDTTASQPTEFGDAEAAGGPAAIRITADEVNNAIVVYASAADFSKVEAALQQLDVPPVQVMVEATIAEVTLSNNLSLGLQYYIRSGKFQALFANGNSSLNNSGTTTAASTTGATDAGSSIFSSFSFVPGLNLAFGATSGSSAILQLLQQLTEVKVLSSPNLMVLNNQSARLQVGDEVPIATGSAVSTLTSNAPVVNTIEYRDTGVILRITPRVNATGGIQLDIAQEVSQVATTTSSTLDSPTISQRLVTSSVAVSDGETIALAGLISDSRERGKNGIPILQDIPYLGALFGTRTDTLKRTELIALITPHVVRNDFQSRAITEELRLKLPLLAPIVRSRGS